MINVNVLFNINVMTTVLVQYKCDDYCNINVLCNIMLKYVHFSAEMLSNFYQGNSFSSQLHSVHSSIQFTAPLFYSSIQFTAPLFYSSIQFNAVKFLHSNVSNFCPISSSQHHTFSSQHLTCTQTRSSHTHTQYLLCYSYK